MMTMLQPAVSVTGSAYCKPQRHLKVLHPPPTNDDLQAIAVLELRLCPLAARNDLAIEFDCDAIAFHAKLFDQLGKDRESAKVFSSPLMNKRIETVSGFEFQVSSQECEIDILLENLKLLGQCRSSKFLERRVLALRSRWQHRIFKVLKWARHAVPQLHTMRPPLADFVDQLWLSQGPAPVLLMI